ncbi:MAG TPA: DNA repair protein RecN [Candidatus Binatia bacterium]|nr:DNA repair protein RecN [Candidatus Binatia bacterium]
MLSVLRIKNLAVVADLTLELESGLNILTGETGAGKSIVIGALNLVLGQRADRSLIRAGAESCTVEAVFSTKGLKAPIASFLEENGLEPCDNNQLLIKRSFTTAGQNRQFINSSPTTLQTVSALGEYLVDIHGPHDHQSLLHTPRQLAILEAYGSLQGPRATFGDLVRQHAEATARKAELIVDERTYAQQLDLLRHQVKEINATGLRPEEESQLEQEHQRATHSARLIELSQSALEILSGDDSLLSRAGGVGRLLQELRRIDVGAENLVATHEQATSTLRELQQELSNYAERLELDPARLRELEDRINFLHGLKRKYGASMADVLAFGAEAQRKLDALEGRDAELERLNAQIAKLEKAVRDAGAELSTRRRKIAPNLSKAVTHQLAALGFAQSHLDVAITTEKTSWTQTGFDTVEFQFAPNPGEPPRPLRAIASSGELARVMLALKTVLAAEDEVPVLVFDEVDANIGGEVAHAVGEKMAQIAKQRQVLCITHLAQVAAHASHHYLVEKQVEAGRTISTIGRLAEKQRVTELARMLGGQSDAARKHAQELLGDRG